MKHDLITRRYMVNATRVQLLPSKRWKWSFEFIITPHKFGYHTDAFMTPVEVYYIYIVPVVKVVRYNGA